MNCRPAGKKKKSVSEMYLLAVEETVIAFGIEAAIDLVVPGVDHDGVGLGEQTKGQPQVADHIAPAVAVFGEHTVLPGMVGGGWHSFPDV